MNRALLDTKVCNITNDMWLDQANKVNIEVCRRLTRFGLGSGFRLRLIDRGTTREYIKTQINENKQTQQ